ncbi:MAG: hypothetical protein V5A52_06355 [Halovenus sp.]
MSTQDIPEKFAEWMGVDRTEVDWHPEIDRDACNDCGLCVVNCGRDTLTWDSDAGQPDVTNPYNCKVGCTTCSVVCPNDALSFPDREYIQETIEEYGLLAKAQQKIRNQSG